MFNVKFKDKILGSIFTYTTYDVKTEQEAIVAFHKFFYKHFSKDNIYSIISIKKIIA